ncbi:putative histone PARylation factor 1-like [Bolinopsis microptera]|uniref:putative histone PARylation factor 1-like n=1 Tax=Bolinopsis microptera TaxID=2820187 RepID=UPI003078EB4E
MSYSELDAMLTKSCETDDEAKKDKILAPFDECMNYIQFANDECDYGMGFELGMCVLAHKTSRNFMGTISSLLPLAYDLLGRKLFSKIMKRICEKEEAQPTN